MKEKKRWRRVENLPWINEKKRRRYKKEKHLQKVVRVRFIKRKNI